MRINSKPLLIANPYSNFHERTKLHEGTKLHEEILHENILQEGIKLHVVTFAGADNFSWKIYTQVGFF